MTSLRTDSSPKRDPGNPQALPRHIFDGTPCPAGAYLVRALRRSRHCPPSAGRAGAGSPPDDHRWRPRAPPAPGRGPDAERGPDPLRRRVEHQHGLGPRRDDVPGESSRRCPRIRPPQLAGRHRAAARLPRRVPWWARHLGQQSHSRVVMPWAPMKTIRWTARARALPRTGRATATSC